VRGRSLIDSEQVRNLGHARSALRSPDRSAVGRITLLDHLPRKTFLLDILTRATHRLNSQYQRDCPSARKPKAVIDDAASLSLGAENDIALKCERDDVTVVYDDQQDVREVELDQG